METEKAQSEAKIVHQREGGRGDERQTHAYKLTVLELGVVLK